MRKLLPLFALYGIAAAQWYAQPARLNNRHQPPKKNLVIALDPRSLKLANGAKVTTWTDLTQWTHAFAQGTVAQQPTFSATGLNGFPGVSFVSASSQSLGFVGDAEMQPTAPFSVFAVIQPAASLVAGNVLGRSNGSTGIYQIGINTNSTNSYYYASATTANIQDTAWNTITSSTAVVAEWEILGSGTNTTGANYYVNGVRTNSIPADSTIVSSAGATTWLSNYRTGSKYWNGLIGPVWMYVGAMSASDHKDIARRMAVRYGIETRIFSPDPGAARAVIPASPLSITTPAPQKNAVVQSTVVDTCTDAPTCSAVFESYRYWMAYTGYPDGGVASEVLLVSASNDKTTWTTGILADALSLHGFQVADPGITYDVAAGKLRVYVVDQFGGNSTPGYIEHVECASNCLDAAGWTNQITLITDAVNGDYLWSPNVLYNSGASRWEMYTVRRGTNRIDVRYSSAPDSGWPATPSATAPLDRPITNATHVAIVREGGMYYGVLQDGTVAPPGASLYAISSVDGLHWRVARGALAYPNVVSWCSSTMYRGGMVRASAGVWDFWPSCRGPNGNDWRIGYTQITGM